MNKYLTGILYGIAIGAALGLLVVPIINRMNDLPDGFTIQAGAEYPPIVVMSIK